MNEKFNTYEGMFLLDSSGSDFNAASQPVTNILARYEAQVLAMKPWDDRRLAYEIQGRKRALYVLAYFKLDPAKVVEIEHDCELDERILRSLILRRDTLTDAQINAPTPATSVVRPVEGATPPVAGAIPAEGATPPVAVEVPPTAEAIVDEPARVEDQPPQDALN